MQNTMMQERRTRPLGVKIIAFLMGIEGIIELVVGIGILIAALTTGHAITVGGHTTIGNIINTIGVFLGGGILLIGILTLIFTWGLWMLKRWAFWATVIIAALNILIHIPDFFTVNHPNILGIILNIVIPIIVLLYFLVYPGVRYAFRA